MLLLSRQGFSSNYYDLDSYQNDVFFRISQEIKTSNDNFKHRSQGPFIFYGLYSLICLIVAGLLDGIPEQQSHTSYSTFQQEAYVFLLFFTITTFIYNQRIYNNKKREIHFEWVIFYFVLLLTVCFALAKYVSGHNLFLKSIQSDWLDVFFVNGDRSQVTFNYIILLLLIINLHPYILIFKTVYIVSARYGCTSFHKSSYIEISIISSKILGILGEKMKLLGNHFVSIGEKMVDRKQKTKSE